MYTLYYNIETSSDLVIVYFFHELYKEYLSFVWLYWSHCVSFGRKFKEYWVICWKIKSFMASLLWTHYNSGLYDLYIPGTCFILNVTLFHCKKVWHSGSMIFIVQASVHNSHTLRRWRHHQFVTTVLQVFPNSTVRISPTDYFHFSLKSWTSFLCPHLQVSFQFWIR